MKIDQPLTLASASPRRRELLSMLGFDFSILIPEIDETPFPEEQPRTYAERLASEKAHAIDTDGLVIAADTIVVKGETILGKPTDDGDARRMLRSLSDASHEVITGVCLRDTIRTVVFSVSTSVVFRRLSDDEIDTYIATGEPMDKAGAYAIQAGAAPMIRSIEGSYTNVVGLPLCELHESLISFLIPST
jgi:septum formation protein